MEYQTCTNCGHKNDPGADKCSDCGDALGSVEASIPTPPENAKTSTKIFWVFGLIGVLLVIGIGLLTLIGLGGYLFSSN